MTLRKGQKVQVSYEAEYDRPLDVSGYPGTVHVVTSGGVRVDAPPGATIEPIEDLQPGDVYYDADNDLLIYAPRDADDVMPWVKSRKPSSTGRVDDAWPRRPLTLVVRDGKAVS